MIKTDSSLEDVINDSVFKSEVDKIIAKIKANRLNRPAPKSGTRYRRDFYDRLNDEGKFNAEFFLSSIGDIWLKKSNLSRDFRETISYICDIAVSNAIEHYNQ
jgi:hypothetical protein